MPACRAPEHDSTTGRRGSGGLRAEVTTVAREVGTTGASGGGGSNPAARGARERRE